MYVNKIEPYLLLSYQDILEYTVKPVLICHIWDKEKLTLSDRWPLKRDSVQMKLSMTGQEKCDLLIQMTAL